MMDLKANHGILGAPLAAKAIILTTIHINYAEDIGIRKAGGAGDVGGAGNIGNTGSHSSSMANKADSCVDSDMEESKNMGARNTNTEGGNTSQKPSIIQLMNPYSDADGDWKAGVMS